MTLQQKIVYANGNSDIIAKLKGTYNPHAAAPVGTSTELQKSIFNAPPSGATTATTQPTANGTANAIQHQDGHGTKRPRDEESDEGEAPMDEEESDVSMEASSDED